MGKSSNTYGRADHAYARQLSDEYMADPTEQGKQKIDEHFDKYFDQPDKDRPTSPTNTNKDRPNTK